MGILKSIYNDIKDSVREIGNNITNLKEDVYYGYIRKDDYCKKQAPYHFWHIGHSILNPFRSIIRGIKNMWNWRTIVWDDRDFDHSYMNIILIHKLQNMEKLFRSKNCHIAEWERVADEIREAREILENLNNGDYEEKIMAEWHEKYPFKGFNFVPTESEKERVEQGLPPRLYEMLDMDGDDDKHKMFKEKYELVEEEEKRLKERLFTLLVKNSGGWWD